VKVGTLMPSLRIHDILGNRTGRNYTSYYNASVRLYKWDDVNRLLATAGLSGSSGARYVYRADGMRIEKVTEITLQWVENPNEDDGSGFYDEITATNKPTTRYFYDGQMCVEDDQRIQMGSEWDPDVIVTRYGIGARGIDFIGYTEAEQSEVVSFPIYDGHGNMVATVKRDGTGFTCGDRRAYDAWGNIRQQTHSGYPEQRYCANLGHREDSESGLTYMRARYYEPWTGRFVSEDPDLSGWNWYSYCGNNPISRIDPTGKYEVEGDRSWFDFCFRMAMANFFAGVAFSLVGGKANSPKLGKLVQSVGQGLIMASAIWFGLALGMTDIEHFMMDLVYGAAGAFLLIAGGISVGLEASKWTNGIGIATVIVAALYSTQVLGALIGIDYW
jgi:RHS repeat-associated protein